MPPHPHASNPPFAHEPWKTLYVAQRLITTTLLTPIWAAHYLLAPQSSRPRQSWSVKQVVIVRFTRRIHKVTEMAGVVWGARDYTKEPAQSSLKETRFQWTDPLPKELQKGVVNDPEAPCVKVGMFVWPKYPKGLTNGSTSTQSMSHFPSSDALQDTLLQNQGHRITYGSGSSLPTHSPDIDPEAMGDIPMIGMFMHGGGYCHMSAEEKSPTSKIPRRLLKVATSYLLTVRS